MYTETLTFSCKKVTTTAKKGHTYEHDILVFTHGSYSFTLKDVGYFTELDELARLINSEDVLVSFYLEDTYFQKSGDGLIIHIGGEVIITEYKIPYVNTRDALKDMYEYYLRTWE